MMVLEAGITIAALMRPKTRQGSSRANANDLKAPKDARLAVLSGIIERQDIWLIEARHRPGFVADL